MAVFPMSYPSKFTSSTTFFRHVLPLSTSFLFRLSASMRLATLQALRDSYLTLYPLLMPPHVILVCSRHHAVHELRILDSIPGILEPRVLFRHRPVRSSYHGTWRNCPSLLLCIITVCRLLHVPSSPLSTKRHPLSRTNTLHVLRRATAMLNTLHPPPSLRHPSAIILIDLASLDF